MIKKLNLGHYVSDVFKEEEKMSEEVTDKVEENISFWFENDELQEIQWGVI